MVGVTVQPVVLEIGPGGEKDKVTFQRLKSINTVVYSIV